MRTLTLIAASLSIAASGCSKAPVRTVSSHPPASDLTCPAEPAALSDAVVIADVEGISDAIFNTDVLISGRECRDALKRVCQWHKERGDNVDCASLAPVKYPR